MDRFFHHWLKYTKKAAGGKPGVEFRMCGSFTIAALGVESPADFARILHQAFL